MRDIGLKHDSPAPLQVLVGFVLLALVVFGAGATIYKLVAPEGWIAQWLGRSLNAGAAAIAALVFIGVLAWFTREWSGPRAKSTLADLFIYASAGAGLLYLLQLWLRCAL